MKLIFSRKGFDSGAGGGPSPIVDGRPVTLPIPGPAHPRAPTYAALGLGAHVTAASRGRLGGADACHHDPFFDAATGQWAFGQADAAQSHLEKQGVGRGDVFLFFGLFAGGGQPRHHRIFGYLNVADILHPARDGPPAFAPDHPHFWGALAARRHNAVYVGPGAMAHAAGDALRLSALDDHRVSRWRVPAWLHRRRGLSYHQADWRWQAGERLQTVGRGQEFVVDVRDDAEAAVWLATIIAAIEQR